MYREDDDRGGLAIVLAVLPIAALVSGYFAWKLRTRDAIQLFIGLVVLTILAAGFFWAWIAPALRRARERERRELEEMRRLKPRMDALDELDGQPPADGSDGPYR